MYVFLKAQLSSFIASIADFLTTFILVQVLAIPYIPGSIAGTVLGGCINFYMNRKWTFNAEEKNIKIQIAKYITVWVGNVALVTLGVYLLTHFMGINYLASKICTSILVGASYNYLMQKHFIFH